MAHRRIDAACVAALLLFTAWGGRLHAQSKPAVGVRLSVEERSYRDNFTEEELRGIERGAAEHLASLLNQRINFVDFIAGDPNILYLSLALKPKNANASGFLKEVGFHVTLIGAHATEGPVYWVFRPEERYIEGLGGVEEFLEEIKQRFNALSDADYRALVTGLLSGVPIAHTGFFWPQAPVGWIIPFTQENIRMDRGSRLRIVNEVRSSVGPVARDFYSLVLAPFNPDNATPFEDQNWRGRLFTEAERPDEISLHVPGLDPNRVAVKSVYVIDYKRFDTSLGPQVADPAGVDFRGDGT